MPVTKFNFTLDRNSEVPFGTHSFYSLYELFPVKVATRYLQVFEP
jgi:hypothetical protein